MVDDAEVVADYLSGMLVKDIMSKYGFTSINPVYRRLHAAKVPLRGRHSVPGPVAVNFGVEKWLARRASVVADYKNDVAVKTIIATHHISQATLWRYLDDFGVKRRQPRRWRIKPSGTDLNYGPCFLCGIIAPKALWRIKRLLKNGAKMNRKTYGHDACLKIEERRVLSDDEYEWVVRRKKKRRFLA